MDLIDQLRQISARISHLEGRLETEEATKHALVMPFIQALGYDVFNPLEVMPEFTADVGTKKGEKVDYAIMQDDKPVLLIEVKKIRATLSIEHASQLYRYYAVSHARFALLTNGVEYQFYADLDEDNKMDSKPFFTFNLLDVEQRDVDQLKRFAKGTFDPSQMIDFAAEIKYTTAIQQLFADELRAPSAEFVKHFASQIYGGRMTQNALMRFTPLVKKSINHYISERISDRLQSALSAESFDRSGDGDESPEGTDEGTTNGDDAPAVGPKGDGVYTTEDELAGFNVVKTILDGFIDVSRVVMRDAKSYCGVLLDDNNRKPIVRLHFNSATTKKISIFDEQRNEQFVYVDGPDDIRQHADAIVAIVKAYDAQG